jgi:phage FluMu protein Com
MINEEDDIDFSKMSYFYFECKECRERWFSTMCYCPRCKGVFEFRILSIEEAQEQMIQNIQNNIIRDHYVMLMEDK